MERRPGVLASAVVYAIIPNYTNLTTETSLIYCVKKHNRRRGARRVQGRLFHSHCRKTPLTLPYVVILTLSIYLFI